MDFCGDIDMDVLLRVDIRRFFAGRAARIVEVGNARVALVSGEVRSREVCVSGAVCAGGLPLFGFPRLLVAAEVEEPLLPVLPVNSDLASTRHDWWYHLWHEGRGQKCITVEESRYS